MRLSHLMLLLALLFAGFAQTAAGPSGHWEGKIQIPEREIAFSLDLAPGPAGGWIGSLSVAGSTSIDVPLENITVAGQAVKFTTALPGATTFEGSLSADSAEAAALAATASEPASAAIAGTASATKDVAVTNAIDERISTTPECVGLD